MKTKNETDSLNESIVMLQNKRAQELDELKQQLHIACESLKPLNLIKSAFHEVADSAEIKNNLVNSAIGLGTGFVSKKLLLGSSHNPFKKIMGTLIQFGVANVISKHVDDIKSIGGNLLNRFLKSNRTKKE
jgi:hypothetical protein